MKEYINTNRIKFIVLSLLIIFLAYSCEDPAPFDYVPQNFVEAYLIVGKPFNNIKIMRSQSLVDSFNYKNSFITDAEVKIKFENQALDLIPNPDIFQGYYYPDTNVVVKPNTKYNLEVRLKDGNIISGETVTPGIIKWKKQLPQLIYYPIDTLKLPANDTLKLSWEQVPGTIVYFIRVKCLDTLEYGKYLVPPTDEKNRRIVRPWERGTSAEYNEITRWGFIPNTETPVVWNSIKWYGLNEVSVLAPDYNFLRWFLQYQRKGQIDPLLTSVKGAIGIFGSYSEVRTTTFVVKNQP